MFEKVFILKFMNYDGYNKFRSFAIFLFCNSNIVKGHYLYAFEFK
jgi:hypothetical protein